MIARSRKTVADYMRLPDDIRMELIEGEFFVSPSPNSVHQRLVVRLVVLLDAHVRARNLGTVYCAPFDCILSDEDVVQPDVLFVAAANVSRIRERLHGPPDLAVEILSPAHEERDRLVKRDLYLKYGVPEYWIVDPRERLVEVRVRGDRAWTTHGVFGPDETLTSRIVPDFQVPVREILEG